MEKRCHPTKRYYTVYRAKDDEILAFGDKETCADMLGISQKSFYSIVAAVRAGRNKKYEIYSEPLDPVAAGICTEEEYEAALREQWVEREERKRYET